MPNKYNGRTTIFGNKAQEQKHMGQSPKGEPN